MGSYSIDRWCEMHKLLRAFFYKPDKLGHAPKTFPVGRARRISEAADAAWIKAREEAASTRADPPKTK